MSDQIQKIRSFYEEAFRAFDPVSDLPPIDVSFYPYIGVNHTIRIRDGRLIVRLAELCRGMPLNGHKALAYVMVARLLRKRVPKAAREAYLSHVRNDEVREQARERRREMGRKVISGANGAVYDLDAMFEKVNLVYFGGRIEKPVLTWSAKPTFRMLGHHDENHRTIVISRSLDDRSVPKYVVEYVLFHEILHIVYPTLIVNGRRQIHSPEFKRHERTFPYYDEAERWIEQNAGSLKRKARRRLF